MDLMSFTMLCFEGAVIVVLFLCANCAVFGVGEPKGYGFVCCLSLSFSSLLHVAGPFSRRTGVFAVCSFISPHFPPILTKACPPYIYTSLPALSAP